ncbi:MAG TPA: peptidoglycan-associated lipoprotein Pal [Gemmatimonadaceae bacterium]|jgi:peptidoglycan-associated lipoprotein|nr:peptidoglycan-associated lipoprotein Pal [Gemmatimonadaceae bacterium]
MTRQHHAAGRSISIGLLATVIVLGACHKKPETAPEPVATPAATPAVDSAAIRDSIARAQAARDAALARQRAYDDSVRRANEAAASAGEQTGLRNTVTAVIHFDFDRSELRDDARSTLDAKIPVLMANPDLTIRVAGHTDERGSVEYNIALGQRRAAAAKRYLTERGVTANRVETVSFGEGRPVNEGHDEDAWGQNRRDEFEITAGGSRLNRPRT